MVSKTVWVLGPKVIDDPDSIRICANKIHQYRLFEKYDVPRIPTMFLNKGKFSSLDLGRYDLVAYSEAPNDCSERRSLENRRLTLTPFFIRD